jgi:DNA-binding NarL/FixJ family response regulator
MMIRVLVAEDMRILRDTLVSVLNLEDDIKVVAQVAAGTDIVPAALAERPDLAVLDGSIRDVAGQAGQAAESAWSRADFARYPVGRPSKMIVSAVVFSVRRWRIAT